MECQSGIFLSESLLQLFRTSSPLLMSYSSFSYLRLGVRKMEEEEKEGNLARKMAAREEDGDLEGSHHAAI